MASLGHDGLSHWLLNQSTGNPVDVENDTENFLNDNTKGGGGGGGDGISTRPYISIHSVFQQHQLEWFCI